MQHQGVKFHVITYNAFTSACYKKRRYQLRPCRTLRICSTKASSSMLSPTTRSPALAIKNMCTILGLAGLRRCAALQGRASCYLLQRSPTFAITIMCTSLGLATLRRYAASNGQAHVITFNAFTSACYKQNLYQLRPCSTLKKCSAKWSNLMLSLTTLPPALAIRDMRFSLGPAAL